MDNERKIYFTWDWKISSAGNDDWIFSARNNCGAWFSITASSRYMEDTYGTR